MVLRDPAADMSLPLTCPRDLVRAAPVQLAEGTQVVVLGKPTFYTGRGSFSLRVSEIRAVGIGELLARIERLRRLLDAEGLFDPRLKRPLPFLPGTIGLITGARRAAEHDVMTVATAAGRRCASRVRNTVVQGPNAVAQIVEALRELDARPGCRRHRASPAAAAASKTCCRSPTRRCAGPSPHAPRRLSAPSATNPTTRCATWSPICAPPRRPTPPSASCPTPQPSRRLVDDLRRRSARALRNWVIREERHLCTLRSRPVLADPLRALITRADEIHRARAAARRDISRLIDRRIDPVGPSVGTTGRTGPVGHPGPRLCGGAGRIRVSCGRLPTLPQEPNCASGWPTVRWPR